MKLYILFIKVSLMIISSSLFSQEHINLYSARQEVLLKPLIEEFEKETNIKVNIIAAKANQLINRIIQEGEHTKADMLLTTDVGRLYIAKKKNIFQHVDTFKINKYIPKQFKDKDNYWFGLSIRSRFMVYNKLKVGNPITIKIGSTTYASGTVVGKTSNSRADRLEDAYNQNQSEYQEPKETLYVIQLSSGAVTTAIAFNPTAVSIDITSTQDRFPFNGVIDTEETVFDNAKKILANMRGIFNYINGIYSLKIEDSEAVTLSIDDDDVLESGIKVSIENKEEKFNIVEVEFANAQKDYELDTATYKHVSATSGQDYKYDDGGEELKLTIEMPFITNYNIVYQNAKAALLRSRNNKTISFTGTHKLLYVKVGELISVTNSRVAMSAEQYRITKMTINNDLTVSVNAVIYQSNIYGYVTPPDENIEIPGDMVDSFKSDTPTNLNFVDKDPTTGVQPYLTWTNPTTYPAYEFRVIVKDSNDNVKYDGRTKNNFFNLTGLEVDNGYTAEVRSLNTNYVESQAATYNFNNSVPPVQNDDLGNGSVTDSKVADISADKITAGTIDASVITVTNLDADNITSGTIGADKITVTDLAAINSNLGDIDAGSLNIGSGAFVVTTAGAMTATSADVVGNLRTGNLVVTGDAGIHGEVRATSITAETVTVESIKQEVWNEIDRRTAPAQNGFYDDFSSTSTNGYYVGAAKNFDLLGTSNNGYQINSKDIDLRAGMVTGFATSTNYTGTALEATFQYFYKLASSSTWTALTPTYVRTTDKYTTPDGYFYELDADPTHRITSGTLTAESYYHFRLTVTPTITNNVWTDSDAGSGYQVEYGVQQSSTGTGAGTGTVTSITASNGITASPTTITTTGSLSLDSTVVRTTGVQSIAGNKTFNNNIVIQGNLTVQGTTTSVNTDDLNVKDKNITLNYSTGDSSASANGAGITIQDAVSATQDATLTWNTTNDSFNFSHPLNVTGAIATTGNITLSSGGTQVKFTGTAGPFGLEFGDTESNPNFRLYYRTTPNTLTFENSGQTAKHTFDLDGDYTAVRDVSVGRNLDVTGTVTADGLTVDSGSSDINIVFDDDSVTNRFKFTTGGNSLDSFFDVNSGSSRASHIRTISGSVSFDIASGFSRNDINFSNADLFIKRSGTKALEVDHATGDISFYDDTGSTQALFWDASAESLGIGTTNPNRELEIASSAPDIRLTDIEGGYSEVSGSGGHFTFKADPGNTQGGSRIAFEIDGSERVRYNTTGVGIGTSSPSTALHVVGTITADTHFTSSDTNTTLSTSGSGGTVRLRPNGLSSTTGQVTVVSSGNVGIGTDSPSRKLEVNAGSTSMAAQFKSTLTSSFVCFANSSSTADQVRIGSNGTALTLSTNYAERMRIDSSGNVGIGLTNPSAYGKFVINGTSNQLAINASSGKSRIALFEGGTGRFYIDTLNGSDGLAFVDADGSSERMRIDSAGNVTVTGVGSFTDNGTDDPQIHMFRGKATRPAYTFTENNTTGMFKPADNNLSFSTNGTERMRIDSSGNLLVGKTNTTLGTVGIENRASGRITSIRSGNTNLVLNRLSSDGSLIDFYKDGSTVGSIGAYNSATAILSGSAGSYSGLYLNTNRIEPVGNNFGSEIRANNTIDIGSSSYKFKDLYLAGTANANALDIKSGSAIHGTITTSSSSLTLNARNTGIMLFQSGGSEKARIDSSGNLLVATTDTTLLNNTSGGGFSVSSNGFTQIAKQGVDNADPVLILNQTGLDGEILRFYKDGGIVGSIGTMNFGDMYLGTDDTGIYFNNGIDSISPINTTNQTVRDNAIDLGASNARFKDLYLAGTANFGSLSDGTITITGFVDQDDMSSDSATLLPTQQSVKAYVDANSFTINNNADNRIITGTATAGTLNAETTLTYGTTGADLAITGASIGSVPPILRLEDVNSSGKLAELKHSAGTTTLTSRNATSNGVLKFAGHNGTSEDEYGRFDATGNLLISKTSTSTSTVGVSISGTQGVRSTVSGNVALLLNRTSSDGDIALFRKDNSTVGSIGTNNGSLFIVGDTSSGNGAGLKFIDGSTERIVPATSGGGEVDNLVDLGQSTHRFKNLHLSGTANVSGVASTELTVTNTTPTLRLIESDQSKEYQVGSYGAAFAVLDASANAFRYVIDTSGNHSFNSGNATFAGNVGIGITNPSSYWGQADNLVVGGTGNDGITIKSSATGNGRLVFTDTASSTAGLNDGGQIHYNHGSDYMALRTNGSERMRIDSSGNLLVGKTAIGSDSVGFQVASSGKIAATVSGSETARFNRTSSDGDIVQFRKNDSTVGSIGTKGGELFISHNGTTDTGLRFRGNGTIIPAIASGSGSNGTQDLGATAYKFKNLYLSSKTMYQASGGNQHSIGVDANDLIIRSETAGSETARFTYGGNVGIGTTSPSEKLHVAGDIKATGNLLTGSHTIGDATATDDTLLIKSAEDTDINIDAGVDSSSIRLKTSATNRIVVDPEGLVGIGTNPSRELELAANNPRFRITDNGGGYSEISGNGGHLTLQADAGNTQGGTRIVYEIDGSEKMRLDSSGNLLVGATAETNWETVAGFRTRQSGSTTITRNGSPPLYVNRLTSDGTLLELRKDGSVGGVLGIQEPQNNANELYIANGTTTGKVGLAFWDYIQTARIAPCSGTGAYRDNAIDLGYSGARFDDIYATNGTIQTSDKNEKQDIQALTDAEQRVAIACKGLIRRFKWQDSVARKDDNPDSNETARYHFGVIAQDLQDAFTAEGLNASDYGMFISSTWTDDDGVEQTRLGVRYNELLAFIITTL